MLLLFLFIQKVQGIAHASSPCHKLVISERLASGYPMSSMAQEEFKSEPLCSKHDSTVMLNPECRQPFSMGNANTAIIYAAATLLHYE